MQAVAGMQNVVLTIVQRNGVGLDSLWLYCRVVTGFSTPRSSNSESAITFAFPSVRYPAEAI